MNYLNNIELKLIKLLNKLKMKQKLSKKAKLYKTEALKQILSAIASPGMISLAGGVPAPESFPLELIKNLSNEVFDKYKTKSLQYNKTCGTDELRGTLSEWMNKKYQMNVEKENILITTGSTQAFDLIGKIFLDPNDNIIAEDPSYLGALWGFDPYQPNYITVKSKEDGIDINELEDKIKKKKNIKFLYIVSTFQNPTGRVIKLSKRKRLAELASRYDFLIIEDDPYSYLRYKGKPVPPIKTFDNNDKIIYLSTFSKILAPGFRIAFAVASKEIIDLLTDAKESADLHTNVFGQLLVNEYIQGNYIDKQIKKIIELYRPRYLTMLRSLKKYFPKTAHWTEPEGGMFCWIELDKDTDTSKLYKRSIENKVAFVPGVYFYANKDTKNTLRLNFSNVSKDKIEEGIKILGSLLK